VLSICHRYVTVQVVNDVALALFSLEVIIKLVAENEPINFFLSRDTGAWNTLDFIIVGVG
jgi:hypothetical protein